ncbi:ribonucleases P/MRP protein subunit POP1-domain-containing protein [Mycena alexandri]|uniref:Ribonucleases P/MRP protein subunit POP1-domain-containing protein n=1 Tax=Mycena alexandri TaxID=1745969 RepID=A0AAD6TCT7_9AGAR|nr:ribonucleases P/MRP protein subunit POP1-domain-containing protein [Mycena alexandri]
MSAKRKEPTGEQTGRERKKQKLDGARTIAVQSNAVAGPSTVGNGVRRLAGVIDVEKFAEARAFEINAMQTGMKTASASATHRVWQTLPRHLRRRAASHDVRRVPLRLRDRARQEMNSVKKKALARLRPKQGKDKRLSRTETFLKRQCDKSWLETHIWHAKRMRMENMWGYRLAVTPTEKAFRPSHRASVHGSILHDASYQSIIQLQGPEKILRTLLDACCDLQGPGPGAKRYLPGARTIDTHIYEPGQYPFGLIGPTSIFWRPIPLPSKPQDASDTAAEPATEGSQPADVEGSQKRGKGKGKGKGKAKEPSDPDAVRRTVWVRTHPATSEKVFAALRDSASSVLDATRKAALPGTQIDNIGVDLEDLSGQVNAFEIMGPKSNQILKGALSPVSQDSREDFNKFWASMTDLQTSGSIPRGMVIGFKVLDPRLKFPPKNAKPRPVAASPIIFPSATLAQSDLWEESVRNSLRKPRYKKKDLDERRSKNLVPGTPLNPLRQDDRVPLMLIQRSIERGASSNDLALHGWTLLLPAGWSMPFFSSLTFTGTRVAGQREHQAQAFEAGTAYFPRDFPCCATYDAQVAARETEEKARWERTPPAKRANYEKLGTRSPWRADWDVVLGVETDTDPSFVPTQREASDAQTAEPTHPWLFRGSAVATLIERLLPMGVAGRPVALFEAVNDLRCKRSLGPLEATPAALLQGALVRVRVTPCTRGRPQDLALIYAMEDAEARLWRQIPRRASEEESELEDVKPPTESIIGYVTTGNFSLSHGEGFAIGAVPVLRFLELGEQAQRLASKELLVKVRDRDGHKCRAAYVELLDV